MLISANITNKEKVFSAVKLLKIIECSLSASLFATLETRREFILETHRSATGQLFSLSLVIVPEA